MHAILRGALLLALCLAPASPAAAATPPSAAADFTTEMRQAADRDPRTYTIDEASVRISRIGPAEPAPHRKGGQADAPAEPGPDPFIVIDNIINIAERLWNIIEKNRPVVDIQTQYASAVPAGITHWSQLEGWQLPKGDIYRVSAKNGYGVTVVDVRYQVLRTCGGSYKGKGKFLTAVTVEPLSVDVLWGYKVSLAAQVPDSSIINAGTSEDPVAGMMPVLKWSIATAVKETNGRALYYLQGDGLLKEVGGPFARGYQTEVVRAVDKAVKSAL